MSEARFDLLRLHKSTAGLSEREIEKIAQHGEIVHCQEGEVVHEAGTPVESVHLVLAGRLSLLAVSTMGSEVPLRQICRDDQFGLLALGNDDPLPVRVTAELNSKLLCIPKAHAEQLLLEFPLWRRNLSSGINQRLLGAFLHEKQPFPRRVVAFIHVTEESRALTHAVMARLGELDEKLGLLSDETSRPAAKTHTVASLLDEGGTLKSTETCRQTIAQWQDVDRIIFDAAATIAAPHLQLITDACDAVYWICTTSATTLKAAEMLETLVNLGPSRKEKQFVIRILPEGEQAAAPAPELKSLSQRDFKVHWHKDDTSVACSRRAGVERIVHHLRGVCVGLALGGGAARGMAHVGVFQAIEQAGIMVDCMSGTSAGALTGVLFAAGYSADFQIERFARDLHPPWYFRMLPYGDVWYMLSKYRLGGWDPMLRKYLFNWQLEQLAIPFTSVAVDLVQARQFLRNSGDASLAILESINLPGLGRPICRKGMALVDGGVLNVVPADVLVAQDANVVIASDVMAGIDFKFSGNEPDTPTEQMRTPSSAATLIRTRTVQDRNLRSLGEGATDVIIEPDVSKVQLSDFKNAASIAREGYVAAEALLPQIRRLLNKVDAKLFSNLY